MEKTFTQLYVHIVFSVKDREALIHNSVQEKIYKYINKIIEASDCKTYIINGMPDHIHILIGISPEISVTEIVTKIKSGSSSFINKYNICKGKFAWQNGYGAFTYSKSQLDAVFNYIKNQQEHHSTKTFTEEYEEFIRLYSN